MRIINIVNYKWRSLAMMLLLSIGLFGNAAQVLAHGDEDHGEAKPTTATTTAGTVTRSVRLGDYEIMLKHAPLEPDAASAGRLFITNFATNEAADNASPALEIESASGAVTQIAVEKMEAAGSYVARIPALTEGTYAIKTKLTYGGETDTAIFSGVEIKHQETAAAETGSSWTQTALMVLFLAVALGLFGGLAYFAVRVFKNKPLADETVSV